MQPLKAYNYETDKPISKTASVIMNVATVIMTPNIPKSRFWEFVNKDGIPVHSPIKFMRNWIITIVPTVSSDASIPTVIYTNKKNIPPKIENIKEVMLKPE